MTLTQMLDFLRRMHNEENATTPNWSDAELLGLIEARTNEAISVIGLVEAIDTSLVSVASQDSYTIPTGVTYLRRVYYDNQPLKYINSRQLEARNSGGIAPTGTPREFTQFAGSIILTPAPSTSSDVIKLWVEKHQDALTNVASTWNMPSIFHHAIADVVLSDMWAKDLNTGLMDRYLNKWTTIHTPKMQQYARRKKRRGMPTTVIDSDSMIETEWGLV